MHTLIEAMDAASDALLERANVLQDRLGSEPDEQTKAAVLRRVDQLVAAADNLDRKQDLYRRLVARLT